MSQKRNDQRRNLLKRLALGSCSILALHGVAQAATATPTATSATPVAANNTVKPLYGNISPFYGNVSAFYGNVSAFYGNVSAFYGNVSAFYGNISPFYGNVSAFYGPLSPFYGNVSAFYGNISPFTASTDAATTGFYGTANDPFWGTGDANPYVKNPSKFVTYSKIRDFWASQSQSFMALQNAWATAKTGNDYQLLANQLQNTILNPASNFWGAAVKDKTKAQDFAAGFSNAALTKAGIKLVNGNTIDPTSLAALSPSDQAMFFLNFYDGLMGYSGTGHVDYWMGQTGWSPALAATVTQHADRVTVGMLDFTVTASKHGGKGSLLQYGTDVFSDGHGAAVSSLIMGSVDGSGIMGVLPDGAAKVIVYNPYDATATTNWTDVGTGISTLAASIFGHGSNAAPTGVLNASLGVPGWTLNPGWNDALASGAAKGHNLVLAAGNDGVTQTANVPWNFAVNPNLLIVGSVGADGTISNFSNRPGESCLVDTASTSGACVEANKLKYRFITAPGELILVSDGAGGLSRQTGTSLAAPLVSGAIALLQTRWPWLASYPNETAQIILKSATPKGTNPGADAVYGAGELNILASQSPLNWGSLEYHSVVDGHASATATPVSGVVTQVRTGTQASWNTSKLYFTAIEKIGATTRDFQIPLASSLVGQSVTTNAGSQLFQSYLSTGLKGWVAAGAKFTGDSDEKARPFGLGFSQGPGVGMGKVADMDVKLNMRPKETNFGFKSTGPYNTEFALTGPSKALRFGFGNGAAALNGETGFSQRSDFQSDRGGANPLLGLASGGAFADLRVGLTKRLALSAGVTQRHDVRDLGVFGVANLDSPVRSYDASAAHVGLDYAVSDGFVVHTGLTRLREGQALLGVQSLSPGDLGHGSTTTGTTLGFDLSLPANLTLSASGTLAKTTTAAGQAFSAGPGGLVSSAGEVAVTRAGLFSRDDRLRLTLSKSMQVDSGAIHYASYGVVDRQTGALGIVDQTVDPTKGRVPAALEMLYGRLLPKSGAEVSVFLRAGTNTGVETVSSGPLNYVAGAKYRVSF
jgi:hypothetical protein